MVKVNLKEIQEYFPQLKRFTARINKEVIDLISEKNRIIVDSDKVMKCLEGIFVISAFGKIHDRFDYEIPNECVKATTKWLCRQGMEDTIIMVNKLNMIDDERDIDDALYALYRVLLEFYLY